MNKLSNEQATALIDDAYLRGMATKLASRRYPAKSQDDLIKAAHTATRLHQSGQVKVSSETDIFSAGLNATNHLVDNDAEAAQKAASLFLQDESYLTAGLMAVQAELAAQG